MINVFISYRRDGGSEVARLIYEKLNQVPDIFPVIDVEKLGAGAFDQQIYRQIEKSDVFVLVLKKGALDRCMYQNDWVRMEIEHAIDNNKMIIPVMEENFIFPETLPKTLSYLKTQNAVIYSHTYFNQMIETLIFRIQSVKTEGIKKEKSKVKETRATQSTYYKEESAKNKNRKIWIFTGIGIFLLVVLAVIYFVVLKSDDGVYILPESDSRVYTDAEIIQLSDYERCLARNEIYARHGLRFKTEEIQAYFDRQSWYKGEMYVENFDESVLNQFEIENIKRILEIESQYGAYDNFE